MVAQAGGGQGDHLLGVSGWERAQKNKESLD